MDNLAPGRHNDLTDVSGLRVGHHTLVAPGRRTGVTVVRLPDSGAVCGVDVRGAAPGTRETDLLDPGCLVDRVHAIVLAGGSAFGLAAADGVAARLFAAGVGWPMGAPGQVVPIVPAAVIFDLGRGGDFAGFPGAEQGAQAYAAATDAPLGLGSVGAGTAAIAGSLAGGIGSASAVLPDESTVAALVVVNAVGSPLHPATGELLAGSWALPGDLPDLGAPSARERAAYSDLRRADLAAAGLLPGAATTIGVVASDLSLTKAQCRRLAGAGHDGLARAISPIHTMLDGDTLFAAATGARPEPTLADLLALHEAAARCVTRAVGRALLAARSALLWPGTAQERLVQAYRDAFPCALGAPPAP